MNTRILFAVVVSMFVCQQVYAQDEPEAEATELEGTWEEVSTMRDGEQIESRNVHLNFASNWVIQNQRIPGTHYYPCVFFRFSVNPEAMPAEIDFGPENLGIYEIEDDLLTICFNRRFRPDRFESTEDYPTTLWVFRRVEEDDE